MAASGPGHDAVKESGRPDAGFPHGIYLADIHMYGASHGPTSDALMLLLSPVDFSDRIDDCERQWAKLVRVLEAKTNAGIA